MNELSMAELQATLVEFSAAAAVLQSQVKALVATHPDPAALRGVFLHEVEKHTARSLALPVPDQLVDRIQTLAGRVLKDMHAAEAARNQAGAPAVA